MEGRETEAENLLSSFARATTKEKGKKERGEINELGPNKERETDGAKTRQAWPLFVQS